MSIYEDGFAEFVEEGKSAEIKGHYRTAVSNYYKALTEACSFLIQLKTGKVPKNHSEIFLFLKVNFPELNSVLNPAFEVYTKAYDSNIDKEELDMVKDVVRKICSRKDIGEKIRKSAEKL